MDIFDYIEKSRHKKLIIALLIVLTLAVNLIEPLYLLTGGYYNEGLWLLSVCVQMLTFLCSMVLLILICSNNFRYNWIVILLMPLIALFISWCLFLLINTITAKVLWAETFEEVTKVKSKKEFRHKIKHSSNTIYNLYVTSKTICDHPVHVTKETFERVNENDTIIINVSNINRNISRVKKLHPTPQDIEKCLNERSLYIDEDKSYLMLATVISKKSVDDNKPRKHSIIYYAKLRINDKMETSFIRVRGMFQSDYQVYESLKVGDPVMIKLTEGKTKSVHVLNWQPTPEEIEKYKTPVRLIEKNR